MAQWVRSLDLTTHTNLSPIRRGFAPGFVNYKKGALDSQPQVIKFTSCLPMVGGSLRVLQFPPPLTYLLKVFNLLTLSVSTEGFQSIDIERIYWRFSIYCHWAYLLKVFNLLTLSVSTEGFQSIDIERIYWRF